MQEYSKLIEFFFNRLKNANMYPIPVGPPNSNESLRSCSVEFVRLAIDVAEFISRCTLDGSVWYLLTVFTRFNKFN